jgi:hypothetical protein
MREASVSAVALQEKGKLGFRYYLLHLPWVFWGIALCIMAYSLGREWPLSPDSSTYLGMSGIRSALYPLFLRFCFLFFPETAHRPLFFVQIVLGMTGALFFVYALQRAFSWKKTRWIEFLLFLLFISPNLDVCQPFWCDILSESLSYPLWLFAAGNIVLFFKESSIKAYRRFFLLAGLLVLTRRQFIFLYPVMVLFLVGLFTFLKPLVEKKQRWPLVLYAVLSIGIADLAERGYHLAAHGAFRHVAFTGLQAIIAPTIFIGPQGADCLKDPKEKAIYAEICAHLPQGGKPLSKFYSTIEYAVSYLPWSGYATGAAYHHLKDTGIPPQELGFVMDETLTTIAARLILHNPLAYLRYLNRAFFLSYFVPARYGYCGILLLFAGLFFLCGHLYRGATFRNRVLLGSAGILFAANVLAVALVEPLLARYTLYTDVFLGAIIIAIVAERKREGERNPALLG